MKLISLSLILLFVIRGYSQENDFKTFKDKRYNYIVYQNHKNEGLISIRLNDTLYNFEIEPNNQLEYQDSSCVVFFSPCGMCCAEYSVIVLYPKPHLLVYFQCYDADLKNHLVAKMDSLTRLVVVDILTEKIVWARTLFKRSDYYGTFTVSARFSNDTIYYGITKEFFEKDYRKYLIYPYKPGKFFPSKLPEH